MNKAKSAIGEDAASVFGTENLQASSAIDRRVFVGMAATAGMALVLGGALSGCANEQESAQPAPEDESREAAPANQDSQEQAGEQEQAPAIGDKSLVAVFSWSGNTLQMAEYISDLTEGDLFRIEPAEAYTQNYDEVLDVARAEQNADARPALAATVENWNEYGTIYLGYPVWWYEVPQIIKTFVEAHDFSGRVVVPFATSGGSGIAGTLPEIEELCPEAEFLEGLTLDGDEVSAQLSRVDVWLDEQGLR